MKSDLLTLNHGCHPRRALAEAKAREGEPSGQSTSRFCGVDSLPLAAHQRCSAGNDSNPSCHSPQKRATQANIRLTRRADACRLGGPVKPGHDMDWQGFTTAGI